MAHAPGDAARWLPQARTGSQEALGQALDACRDYLLRIAGDELHADLRAKGGASDIVQEALLEAQRDFGQFHGTSEDELLAWLRRLLLNNVADFTRRFRAGKRFAGREVALETDSQADPAGQFAIDTPSPSGHAMAQEELAELERALARLPEEYSQIIRWRYHEELSFEEIARRLERTENAARKLWFRAVERLRQEMSPP